MLYNILAMLVMAVYTLILAKFFIGIGMKLSDNGVKQIKIMPKVPRKPKESKEMKRYNDIIWNIENFHGVGSQEREIK